MFKPVLVEPPAALPVTLEEVKTALRVDGTDSDAEIERLIRSAVAHYEGWSGVLGICLVEQTWRQDYGRFEQLMALGLRPVQEVVSVKWRNAVGQISTVPSASYALKEDGGGRSIVRFVNDFSMPGDLYETEPVFIEFKVGWPLGGDGKPTTPADIQTAIILRVQKHFDEAAQLASDVLERVERDLVAKYRTPLL